MGLFAMAMADLLVLIAYSLLNVLSGFSLSENILMASILCKVLTFTTHAMTSISIWCWLLMSTLRYLAVCHPLFHLRLWRAPHRAIILIIFMSSITNIWLLFAVDQGPSDCVQHPLNGVSNLNRLMHLIESIWSFCLPLAIIIYMDARVLLCRPLDFKTTSGSRLARNNRMRCEAKAALWKWLAIAFIDSLLNTPENLYRLAVLCGMPVAAPNIYNISARIVAQ
uniref:G-protein coupled receptors family 1 profile domain-containing protein n=1 Tax=Plectus sambesii TaxID=2011161 RepID=A0A914V4I1_9BILA